MKSAAHILDSQLCASLGELIAPTRCAGCERQGVLLCRECLASLSRDYLSEQACPKCAGPYGALTCTECWEVDYCFEAALAASILDGPLARAIVLFKDSNERRLADLLGHILAERIQNIWGIWADVVCWVPATKEAIRRRGFDHGELLARSVADYLGLPALQLLARPQARDQRGLSRKQRLECAQDFVYTGHTPPTYKPSLSPQQPLPPPQKVLLIDDVFTTGATVEAASQALLEAGIQQIRVAVLGRAW